MSAVPGMDGDWHFDLWRPTSSRFASTHPERPMSMLSKHSNIIIDLTKRIRKNPTNTELWYQRAISLDNLGYPDLAAGDLWKAILLIDRQLLVHKQIRAQISLVDANRNFASIMDKLGAAYQKLMIIVMGLREFSGVVDLCKDGITKYGAFLKDFLRVFQALALEAMDRKREMYLRTTNLDEDTRETYSRWGGVMHFAYPFMPAKYMSRQEDVTKPAMALFQDASSKCELRVTSSDVLGVFATSDIAPKERFLSEIPVFAASSVSSSAPSTMHATNPPIALCDNCCGFFQEYKKTLLECCQAIYCSKRCHSLALSTYHKVLCGKNFSKLYPDVQKKPKELSETNAQSAETLSTSSKLTRKRRQLPHRRSSDA
ncbi:hypothetical protein MMC13_000879 [Lambiella insularis]|nr:hypothetical protein [Lambiella insularis]